MNKRLELKIKEIISILQTALIKDDAKLTEAILVNLQSVLDGYIDAAHRDTYVKKYSRPEIAQKKINKFTNDSSQGITIIKTKPQTKGK